MAKIIKLNENDLKRIVVKVLNERRLNEEDEVTNGLAPGAITQDVADQLKYTESQTSEPMDRFESICNVCTSGKEGLGPITQSESALDGIAEKIYNAVEETQVWLTFGAGTDEKKVANGIRNTKSFPDFCYMIDSYSRKYEDFFESMDGDFDDDADQRMYLISPVADVINYSTKLIGKKSDEIVKTDDKDKKDDTVIGGGGEEDNWNMYMCVIEHPKAIGEKFADGKRTRFRIGTDYYMGNGKKIRKGIELDYSCEDKEFDNVDFADKENEGNNKGNKRPINAEIKDIQNFLTDEGYDISTDGRVGPETAGAILDYIVDNNSDEFKPASVIELQKKMNSCYSMKIKEDGKVGPETLNAIADALESAQQGDLC
jgi:hypothetical protein